MGMTNDEIIKSAITAADALASYGKLNPRQADTWIDYVVDESFLKNNARIVKFRNEQFDIDKIGIGARVMQPATEMVAPSNRRGVTTSKISLNPKEVILPWEISDSFLELSIEGAKGEDHIMRMFAKQAANDLEHLCLRGDILGEAGLESDLWEGGSTSQYVKDPLLSLYQGWLRLADAGHTLDVAGADISLTVFSDMINSMPTKFRRNKRNLRFFMAPNLAQLYVEKISAREDMKGVRAAEGEMQTPFGIPIVEVPLMEFEPTVVEHVTLPGTTAVSLRYKPIVSASEVVTPNTLGTTPTTPYVEGSDYDMNYTNGTIARNGGGVIGDGATVKITYKAYPQIILTHWENYLVGIGRDMTMEKQRDIYKRGNEYVMHMKISCQVEETDALVKAYNINRT